ncbi:MAG: sodium:calcium antiporter, partial [Chloroflexota bacterium]|nr:sodium:calcium antiporter [Chloroflexota bacterium]
MGNRGRMYRNWTALGLAMSIGLPAVAIRIGAAVTGEHLSPGVSAIVFGAGIVGAAFLITWAAEVAQMDISAALALAILALVAVLPEYAVDMVFAWKAGAHPEGLMVGGELVNYKAYAAANMTGGNRLLVGIGWPLVALLFWLKQRKSVHLGRGVSLELIFLGAATLYSFLIVIRREIALWDAGVLIGLFVVYIWFSGKQEKKEEPALMGPAASLGALSKLWRRLWVLFLFIFAAAVIILSAEPFAEGLINVGKEMGIDEFILVQWVAPLASESPEIIVACILALSARPTMAMMALISSKVNQWTLLVGTLPVVYSVSLGRASGLALDSRQTEEFLLTAAQS